MGLSSGWIAWALFAAFPGEVTIDTPYGRHTGEASWGDSAQLILRQETASGGTIERRFTPGNGTLALSDSALRIWLKGASDRELADNALMAAFVGDAAAPVALNVAETWIEGGRPELGLAWTSSLLYRPRPVHLRQRAEDLQLLAAWRLQSTDTSRLAAAWLVARPATGSSCLGWVVAADLALARGEPKDALRNALTPIAAGAPVSRFLPHAYALSILACQRLAPTWDSEHPYRQAARYLRAEMKAQGLAWPPELAVSDPFSNASPQ